MNNKFIYAWFLAALTLLPLESGAVKAKPEIIEYIQEDGTPIKIRLHGDERFHYVTNEDGAVLILNEKGIYEYAVLDDKGLVVNSGVNALSSPTEVYTRLIYKMPEPVLSKRFSRAKRITRSSSVNGETKLYRYSTSAFPTKGEPHSLVVLVEYPDYRFNIENPKEYFKDFLNGENFTADDATGSVREYYIENSFGQFKPTFDLYGPVMMKNNRIYYGGGNEDKAGEMVVEAVEALDDDVDFSQYDHNEDGYVDSIYIIYADKGEADGGPGESVWPFSWELEEEGIFLEADGVKFNTYGVSNELKNNGEIEGIGTFTHEFGHVLGLPDLYNTEKYYDYSTPLEWSLMDSGNYNNESHTPCNLSSFERYSLGWLSPEEIVCTDVYSLDQLATTNKAVIMTTEENPDEFFMMEYRAKEGWDEYLPSQGMLIWHIDFNQNLWDWNTPNNVKDHHRVDLVRADNIKDKKTLEDDAFPANGKNEFSTETKPALKSWSGNVLNVIKISDIKEETGKMSFQAEVTEEREPTTGATVFQQEEKVSIIGKTIYSTSGIFPVYDLTGRNMGEVSPSSPLNLSRGLYIVGSKKYLIK